MGPFLGEGAAVEDIDHDAATPRILFIGSGKGWHARGVLHTLLKRGLRPVVAPLDACSFSTDAPFGIHVPGLGSALPDAVFVRMVPGGSFEQVTFYLGILHGLQSYGVPIWNDARAIENCTDKSTTTFLLNKAGIATPKSWCGVSKECAMDLAEDAHRDGRALVQKPLFGSQGRGLRLICGPEDLAPEDDVAGVYYLQAFVGDLEAQAQDLRLFVCENKVLAAMIRHGAGWITNVRQGGRAEAFIASNALKDLAVRSVQAVGAQYAGVDVMQNANGDYQVLEVNSMPAWAALQRVTGVPIADLVVDAFLAATLKPSIAAQPVSPP